MRPTSRDWHNLNSPHIHTVMVDEANGDLPIGIILGNDIHVLSVLVHT